MVAQIPLPWQLTDLFCAMGLGALYGAVYLLLLRLLHKKLPPPPAMDGPRVYGTAEKAYRYHRMRKRARRAVAFFIEALFAFACCMVTRAWVLTASRAAQFRWSMAAGIAVGFWAFWAGVKPVLRRCRRAFLRRSAPVRRLYGRAAERRHARRLQARERNRVRFQRREDRLAARKNARQMEKEQAVQRQKQKEFEKNEQKELQTPRKVYYNNL